MCVLMEGSVGLSAAQETGVTPLLCPHGALHPAHSAQSWSPPALHLSTRARRLVQAGVRGQAGWAATPLRGKSPGRQGQEPPGLGQDCLLSGQGVGGGPAKSTPPF